MMGQKWRQGNSWDFTIMQQEMMRPKTKTLALRLEGKEQMGKVRNGCEQDKMTGEKQKIEERGKLMVLTVQLGKVARGGGLSQGKMYIFL